MYNKCILYKQEVMPLIFNQKQKRIFLVAFKQSINFLHTRDDIQLVIIEFPALIIWHFGGNWMSGRNINCDRYYFLLIQILCMEMSFVCSFITWDSWPQRRIKWCLTLQLPFRIILFEEKKQFCLSPRDVLAATWHDPIVGLVVTQSSNIWKRSTHQHTRYSSWYLTNWIRGQLHCQYWP